MLWNVLVLIISVSYTVHMVKQVSKKQPKKVTKPSAKNVDFEPNKMGFAVAVLAAVSLTVLGLLAMYS